MKAYVVEGRKDSPNIVLDPGSGRFEIIGKSFPEDCNAVYDPVLEWLEEFAASKPQELSFRFSLDYISSTSAISILKILLKLKEFMGHGSKVNIEWCYEEDDEDILIAGEKYVQATEMDFEFKPIIE